jgi:hypothetical protein
VFQDSRDPYATNLGRLRSQEALPKRVRTSRLGRIDMMAPAFEHAEAKRAEEIGAGI